MFMGMRVCQLLLIPLRTAVLPEPTPITMRPCTQPHQAHPRTQILTPYNSSRNSSILHLHLWDNRCTHPGLSDVNEEDVADMLLRHFSLHGDEVLFVNAPDVGPNKHGRRITYEPFQAARCDKGVYSQFQQSSYFKRFVVERDRPSSVLHKRVPTSFDSVEVYQGDCFEVLAQLSANSIDGAVTSPPYYNARSYSVWPNIYCYLYDMYNSAHEVFRVLKPGSVYLFNIFDYFDNENNIVFSAMGKKRMILGAYIINIFRRVGFELAGNVVWYKGEIEGKRNFNQGNRSSYYQFPLNSWEHVFVFQKPGERSTQYRFPTVLAAKPVFKIINGKNVLGHSAPFPSQIPELLLNQMKPGEQVLDPYSGSMTTGRAAYRLGLRSVSIDIHQDYCQLGLHLLDEENASLLMFNMIR